MSVNSSPLAVAVLRIYAVLLLAIGVALLAGGIHLARLGGSPYYVLTGVTVVISAVLLWRKRALGAMLYGAMLFATLAWAVWESGFDGWALMPRLVGPLVLGAVLLIPALRNVLVREGSAWSLARVVAAGVVALLIGAGLRSVVPPPIPTDPLYQTGMGSAPAAKPVALDPADHDWPTYGKDKNAARFSTLNQITPENVNNLELVWSARIGPAPTGLEVTPLKIGNTLYACNTANDVMALDAETGKELWRYQGKSDRTNIHNPVCRGVAYYRVPDMTGVCAGRIITNTVDGRLIAVDAETGVPCPDFGDNGVVSLRTGMGKVIPGYLKFSSAPTIVNGRVVVGGSVNDNQFWGEPSGVIRAYDAATGKLAWAWDVGRPDSTGEPAEGETYTPSTPNAWAPLTGDDTLGLVYVSTGVGTPDYFGGHRRPFDDQYSTSVVALDVNTGKVRWSFQTVHHDVWDFDNPSGATLMDIPRGEGAVPALLLPTKTGELFVLNRATGEPVYAVEERPAPQKGAAPEERLSPTQPYSVAMPSFRSADLTEGAMWGITPLDQLWCRIKFKEARYEGIYTPPGVQPAVFAPGMAGGMEWGGVALDLTRNIAIINSSNMPTYVRLMTRAEADGRGMKPQTPEDPRMVDFGKRAAQANTDYAVEAGMFFSPLNVPCNQPPFGRVSAVDMTTGKLIWTQVFGNARMVGPKGIRSYLPFNIGTFNMGGAVVTGTGVFFISSAMDRYLRAYETATGKELWKADLPAAGNATPMTYMSDGRQFVVVAAAGALGIETKPGDYLVAYALPKATAK